MQLWKIGVVFLVLLFGGWIGYAYLGDMNAHQQEMRIPVPLDLGSAPAAPVSQTDTQGATDAPAQDSDPNALD